MPSYHVQLPDLLHAVKPSDVSSGPAAGDLVHGDLLVGVDECLVDAVQPDHGDARHNDVNGGLR